MAEGARIRLGLGRKCSGASIALCARSSLISRRPSGPRAIDKAVAFVTDRLNGEDGLGAIFPAMVNSVLMFDALGYSKDDARVRTARTSLDKLLVIKEDEAYCQPCLSPVWDTALTAHALLEVGGSDCEQRARVEPRMAPAVAGARQDRRLGVQAGPPCAPAAGPSNTPTPIIPTSTTPPSSSWPWIALRASIGDGLHDTYREAIDRGQEWIVGLQSSNGGWAAFDADNEYYYLNQIPFSDHGALFDPPTADVTARCVSMLAQLGAKPGENELLDRGIAYLLRDAGEGRKLVWPLGHELHLWHVVRALRAQRGAHRCASSPAMQKAVRWLVSIQNSGWRLGRGRRELPARL